jgi:hypothetical protein
MNAKRDNQDYEAFPGDISNSNSDLSNILYREDKDKNVRESKSRDKKSHNKSQKIVSKL